MAIPSLSYCLIVFPSAGFGLAVFTVPHPKRLSRLLSDTETIPFFLLFFPLGSTFIPIACILD